MNYNSVIRTPYHQLPVTLLNKAMHQKMYREQHCTECGMPIAEITDKIITVFDGNTPIEKLIPDVIGIVEIHCKRHTCKQFFRMEFAV